MKNFVFSPLFSQSPQVKSLLAAGLWNNVKGGLNEQNAPSAGDKYMQMRCTNKGAWTEKYLQFQQNAACSSKMNSFDKMVTKSTFLSSRVFYIAIDHCHCSPVEHAQVFCTVSENCLNICFKAFMKYNQWAASGLLLWFFFFPLSVFWMLLELFYLLVFPGLMLPESHGAISRFGDCLFHGLEWFFLKKISMKRGFRLITSQNWLWGRVWTMAGNSTQTTTFNDGNQV